MNETKLENGPAAASEGIDKTAGTSVFINSKKENIFKPIQAVSGVYRVNSLCRSFRTSCLFKKASR